MASIEVKILLLSRYHVGLSGSKFLRLYAVSLSVRFASGTTYRRVFCSFPKVDVLIFRALRITRASCFELAWFETRCVQDQGVGIATAAGLQLDLQEPDNMTGLGRTCFAILLKLVARFWCSTGLHLEDYMRTEPGNLKYFHQWMLQAVFTV